MRVSRPPAGFEELRSAGVRVWVLKGFSFLFDRAGNLSATAPCGAVSSSPVVRGRAEMARVALDPRGKAWGLVRHYRRGGLLGGLLRDGYLGWRRFFRELEVTEEARARGVPTVEVLAVRSQRVAPCVYRGDLVTREIAGAVDLQAYLQSVLQGAAGLERQDRARVVAAVAGAVRSMHDAGVVHADLNLKNVLLRGGGRDPECLVIDLDKARILDRPVGARGRMRNVIRLYRSLEKQGFAGRGVTPRDMIRFAAVYGAGDAAWMRAVRMRLRRPPLSLRVHRFFWRLFRNGP